MVQAAYANNSSSIFQARFDRYINDVLSAPMRPWQMTLGYTVGGVLRALAIGVLAARARDRRSPACPVAAAARCWSRRSLLGLVLFGALGVVVGIYAETWDHTTFIDNIVILPLAFVGGVFYSVSLLPLAVARAVARQPGLLPRERDALRVPRHQRRVHWLCLGVTAALAIPVYVWSQCLFSSGRKLKA